MFLRGNGTAIDHFFFSSRRRHTRYWRDWSSDVCSSDLFVEHRETGRGDGAYPTRRSRQQRLLDAHRHAQRSEEHTSELQSRQYLVCRLLLEKKKIRYRQIRSHTCRARFSVPQASCCSSR